MKRYSILTMILCLFMSFTCVAQTKKAGTAQKKPVTTQKKSTTSQKKSTTSSSASAIVNDGAEISLKGRIDYLQIGNDKGDKPFQIDKNIKANYIFKVFRDPTDGTLQRDGEKGTGLSGKFLYGTRYHHHRTEQSTWHLSRVRHKTQQRVATTDGFH